MATTTFIKSNKYTGVFHYLLSNGDLSYYITYKIKDKKTREHMGKKSEGITPQYCHQQRNEAINKARFGDYAPIIKYKQNKGISLSDLVEQYQKSRELSTKTIKHLSFISSTITDITDKIYLSEFTTDDINKIKNTLKTNGKAAKTINNLIGWASTLFTFAIDNGDFKGLNPCKKVVKIKGNNARDCYLTRDEVSTLKEAIKDKPILLLFVELSLSTGGRLETIMSIRKKDVNLEQRIINLQNHKSKNDYKGFIADSLKPLLKRRFDEMNSPNDLLITTSSRNIQRPLQATLNKLFNQGLEVKDSKNRAVVHTLRHTFASHLAIKGVPIYTIMKLLDHKEYKDTLRYAKLAPDNGLDAVKELW